MNPANPQPANQPNPSPENHVIGITRAESVPLYQLPSKVAKVRTQVPPETCLVILTRDEKLNWLNVIYVSVLGDSIFGWVYVKDIEMFLRQEKPFEQLMDLKITEYEHNSADDFKLHAEALERERRKVSSQKSSIGIASLLAVLLLGGGLFLLGLEIMAGALPLLLAIGLFIYDSKRVGSINRPLNERMQGLYQERRNCEALEQKKRREERTDLGNWFEDTKDAVESAAKKAAGLAAAGGTALAAIAALKAANAASERERQRKHQLNVERARGQKDIRVRHD